MNYFTIIRRLDEYYLYWNSYTDYTVIDYNEVCKLRKQAKKRWRDQCHVIMTGVIK